MTRQDDLKDLGFKYGPMLHRALISITRGRLFNSFGGLPVVELHTTGRKTGKARVTTLIAPIITDERVVLVASKGGDDRNPTWVLNLQANPDVSLSVAGERRSMRARVASADEKAELWPQIVAAYRGYANYQKRTHRDIPVVICEPRGGGE
jgi:deazaflavin-dependent oxidoreductase (nitroreductase family)